MGSEIHPPRLVWRDPLERFVAEVREDADRFRDLPGGSEAAKTFDRFAETLEKRIEEAMHDDWLEVEDAAPILDITPDAVRARCRRRWEAEGRAKKKGGTWYVHVSALTAAAA